MAEINKNIDYMRFVNDLHKTMLDKKLLLVYQGEITHQLTKSLTYLTESNLDKLSEATGVKTKVFHIMMECLQNITKYADDAETGKSTSTSTGIVVVEKLSNEYSVTTGNPVAKEKIEGLKTMLDNLNKLNKEELTTLYKKQLRGGSVSEKGGAGLGFIDIARKTGQNLLYHFEPINNKTSFFMLRVRILRNN